MIQCPALLTSCFAERSGAFLSSALFSRDLRAFLARFRQPDRDGLLPALHFAAFAATAALEGAFLLATHRTLDALACRFTVLSTARLLSRCHGRLFLSLL